MEYGKEANLVNKNNKKKSKSKFWYILFLLPLLALSVFMYFILFPETEEHEPYGEGRPILEEDLILEGEVLLSLSPVGEDVIHLYSLDLSTMELKRFFDQNEDMVSESAMGKFSFDFNEMVFVSYNGDDYAQLMLYDAEEETVSEITGPLNYFPNNLSFSFSGNQVVFWAYESEEDPLGVGAKPEDHSIFVSSLDGEIEKVANGLYPIFYPSDVSSKIMFLKNDGIYILDLEKELELFVIDWDPSYIDDWFTENPELDQDDLPNWSTFRFTLSRDGKNLLLTDTFVSLIHFFETVEKDDYLYNFNVVETVEIIGPNWPVFSPGNEFYAIQEYEGYEQNSSTLVGIYDFVSRSKLREFSLDGFDIDSIFVTDWFIR